MAFPSTTSPLRASSPEAVPPLENGDTLTRTEFERRYEAMPHLKKAELIEGGVYVGSPVRHQYHGKQHSRLVAWLVRYEASTPGVEVGDNSTVRLDLDNEPQPDLVAEVAASSASYDLHAKLNAYRRNGVREYIVWRVYNHQIDWYVLRGGAYELL